MFPTCLKQGTGPGLRSTGLLGLLAFSPQPSCPWLLGPDASVTIDQLKLVSSYLTRLETKV